jgi:cation transport ATPase
MHVARIIIQQAAGTAAPTQSPPAPKAPLAPQELELKEQIKQSIRAAQEAAREARDQARDAQNQARDAQNQARDVQAQAGLPVIAQTGSHTIQLDDFPNNVIPPQVVDISIGFFVMCAVMVIGWPLARAFGRRLERSGPAGATAVPAAMGEQLERIEQAVEAMSIEIERISESQRFLTKLQSSNAPEHAALPASERR